MLPPGCCSRFVWPTRSTSLLARALIVVCSRGSQQKYCVALSEKSWCGSSVCDEYMLFLLAKWLGIHLTRVHGPTSDQSALLEASISRFRLQWLCRLYLLTLGTLERCVAASTGEIQQPDACTRRPQHWGRGTGRLDRYTNEEN